MGESGITGENHRPAASHWQILSHNVALSTPRLNGIRTHRVVIGAYCIGNYKFNYHTIKTTTAPWSMRIIWLNEENLLNGTQFADSPSNMIDAGYNCSLQIKHKTKSVFINKSKFQHIFYHILPLMDSQGHPGKTTRFGNLCPNPMLELISG